MPAPPLSAPPEIAQAPSADSAPARMLGPLFWMLMGFCLICAVAGLIVGRLGPRLFPAKPAAAPIPAVRALGKSAAHG